MNDLELGMIGNCAINALIDGDAQIVWACFPRFDGDPVFARLLDDDRERGFWRIELIGAARSEQRYLPNTAILETIQWNEAGDGIRIVDFCPRFEQFGRTFRPTTIVRMVEPIGEAVQIRVAIDALEDYGARSRRCTRGSNHIRYEGGDGALRLTTSAPLGYVLEREPFFLDRPQAFFFGADESLRAPVLETAREFYENTHHYWRSLVGRLHVPLEYQEAVIRSAITLKLCAFEETGAIIASPTTSLPEAAGEGRNWDYRYCWLRDAFFVVRTLNRLGTIETMEDYLSYLTNLVARSKDHYLQPVFGIGLEKRLVERQVDTLAGYRGEKPVRVGNQAYEHDQHDGYGSVILAVARAFFDTRLTRPAGLAAFRQLEALGEKAWEYHEAPDAGLWEFRTKARVHTHSSVMCWAACDRLARIADRLGEDVRARHWRERADRVHEVVCKRGFDPERNTFVASFEGDELDASLLLLHEIGFVDPEDPRFVGTVEACEKELRKGAHVYRYVSEDDFGAPEHAFVICSFWMVDALIAIGRREEAREMFGELLGVRNRLGLYAEHVHKATGELWGNFPQTYSHAGLITCAMKLSARWDDVV